MLTSFRFTDVVFVSHAPHMLLSIYQLGGTAAVIEGAWKIEVAYQHETHPSPYPITEANFGDHLRKKEYWTAYKDFFSEALRGKGIGPVLEEYLFTPEYNKPPRRMLSRFLMGIVHPIIHAGYGCEFGLPGMVAEGLAMACVQKDDMADMFPHSTFPWNGNDSDIAQSVANVTARMSSVALSGSVSDLGPHALEILAKIANDADFAPTALGIQDCGFGELRMEQVLERIGPKFFQSVSEWTVNGADQDEIYRKIEEVIWMNVVMYGVAGWGGRHISSSKIFNAEFFLLHLVTSVIFLHSFVPYLSGRSMSTLLRAYFSTSLLLYVARGRPALPIRDFFASTNAQPRAPGPAPTPHKDAVTSDPTANPWFSILQTCGARRPPVGSRT
ncbi:hypothetical protein C8Q72DRAFT_841961 [Fomitopsis betulina]|nr:hypothetical protein C8Q72DRAFT_841961 [Fomitopsis betulina]